MKLALKLKDKFTFDARALASEIVCPHFNNYTKELHQHRAILVRDLSVFGRFVYLQVPRRQFYCPAWSTLHYKLSFFDRKIRHTQRYKQNIYVRVQQSSMEQIGREERLSYDEIKGIFTHVNYCKKKNCWESVKRVSIDEISMRK